VIAGPAADGLVPAIRTLGAFAVLRGGRSVPLHEWQSRKAREVLKILVARRGRPVRRDVLMEALWPEQDPARTANRLSVALSILRAVLDPERLDGAEPVVVADRYAVAIAASRVEVDVEGFLALAADGLALWRRGARERALPVLEAAERAYAGDFLEEDQDAEWAVPLREEARAAYLAVAELLASASGPERAVGYRLRMLERDPFDERSHLHLVAGLTSLGRHGEALRAYSRYRERMLRIGVVPAPPPAAAGPPTLDRAAA
jgi:DNA-binding SARP family transcriptional activator